MLPDYANNSTGHIRTTTASKDNNNNTEQILMMNNERFMIPEILMHPSDIGLNQAGIPEAITQSVNACDTCKNMNYLLYYFTYIYSLIIVTHGLLYANIVLVGGNANIPGYQERM